MKLEVLVGNNIHDVLKQATSQNTEEDVCFDFNEQQFRVLKGESFESAKERWQKETGIEVLTSEETAERARQWLDTESKKNADEIKNAGVPTESELREQEVPHPKTVSELSDYIKSLVERPHDYGTCVYAMSLSAVAAFNYVAGQLGVSGFQASCADLDIVRRTRRLKHGFQIINYENLLYPQYLDEEHFPTWQKLLDDKELRGRLKKEAERLIIESPRAHPDVRAHWKRIADFEVIE